MARVPVSSRTGCMALGGILAAGALAMLYLACVFPTGSLGLTAAAGLFPVVAVLFAGRGTGYLCWAASGVLGLLLVPDKGVALMYLVFLGLYPVVKSRIEMLKLQVIQWVCKLAFFNAALALFWIVLRELFLPALPLWLADQVWLVVALGNVVFVIYDIGLSRLIAAFMVRIRPGRRR